MTEARQELREQIRQDLITNLPRYRWWSGMSIQDLAKASAVSANRISDFENGREEVPGPRTIGMLAQALSCQIKDLIPLSHERP